MVKWMRQGRAGGWGLGAWGVGLGWAAGGVWVGLQGGLVLLPSTLLLLQGDDLAQALSGWSGCGGGLSAPGWGAGLGAGLGGLGWARGWAGGWAGGWHLNFIKSLKILKIFKI